MLERLAYRMLTELSPRLAWKAAYLWAYQGMRAMAAHRRRIGRGELFPPFLFLALTSACNLRCRGCWVDHPGPPEQLTLDEIDAVIAAGRPQRVRFYTLLGGEPMLYPDLWEIVRRHADCYFQIITNGMFFDAENVPRIGRLATSRRW